MSRNISIIVPTISRTTLLRLLGTLQHQTFESDRYEVVIIFDGDRSMELQQLETLFSNSINLRTFEQSRKGVGPARNLGARESSGRLLIFLDDDLAAAPDLLELHWNRHEQLGSKSLVFGNVQIDPKSPESFLKDRTELRRRKFFEDCENGRSTAPWFFSGGHFSILKESFWSAGGFDEEFQGYGWEEADFGIRLKNLGFQFVYLKNAVVMEWYSKDFDLASEETAQEIAANEIRFLRKHAAFREHLDLAKIFSGRWMARMLIRISWWKPGILQFVSRCVPYDRWRFALRYLLNFWKAVKRAGMTRAELKEIFGNQPTRSR